MKSGVGLCIDEFDIVQLAVHSTMKTFAITPFEKKAFFIRVDPS